MASTIGAENKIGRSFIVPSTSRSPRYAFDASGAGISHDTEHDQPKSAQAVPMMRTARSASSREPSDVSIEKPPPPPPMDGIAHQISIPILSTNAAASR
jgi:hypothetical protein